MLSSPAPSAGALRTPASPASRRRALLLALSSPLLILLAVLGLLHRTGSARWQALPALLIGVGLLLTSLARRRQRRGEMLRDLRRQRKA